jgi:hypothetical protein
MADDELFDLLVQDAWDELPEELREEFLERRRASSTDWESCPRQESGGRRWEPLRPVVIGERAYRGLESIAARLLHVAVDACRRRASTLGELHRALRFPHDLPLMDPCRPLVAAELTRYARPDIMIEHGRPRFLEFNNSTRLGGAAVTPRLAEAYARLCPQSGLYPPPSSVTARSTALARTLRAKIGHGNGGRLLMPAYRAIDKSTGMVRRYETAKSRILADAQRIGLEVVRADLADLHVDAAGRLLAADVPIDLVLLEWGGNRIVDDGGGLAALRAADRARTVELFPRTESALISSKAVLSWLHEDCDAGVLSASDHALVRSHIPWTVCLGLNGDPAAQWKLLRRRCVLRKPDFEAGLGVSRCRSRPRVAIGSAAPRRTRPHYDAVPRSRLRAAGQRTGAVRDQPVHPRWRGSKLGGAPHGPGRPPRCGDQRESGCIPERGAACPGAAHTSPAQLVR